MHSLHLNMVVNNMNSLRKCCNNVDHLCRALICAHDFLSVSTQVNATSAPFPVATFRTAMQRIFSANDSVIPLDPFLLSYFVNV